MRNPCFDRGRYGYWMLRNFHGFAPVVDRKMPGPMWEPQKGLTVEQNMDFPPGLFVIAHEHRVMLGLLM